jgi:hypothetical protein
MPSALDLTAARRANSFVGALTVVAVFLIGRGLANRSAGVIAALVLDPHPLAIYLWSLAGSDALLGLLVVLAALSAMGLAARPSWPRAVLLGVLLGFGGATKLSPLLIALALAGLGALLVWRGRRGRAPTVSALGWRLLAQPFVAAATFVASYPFLWPDPIDRTRMLFWFRAHEMENQGIIWTNLEVPTRTEALARIGQWLGVHDTTSGTVLAWLGGRTGHAWPPIALDLPLDLIGAEVFAILAMRRGLGSPPTLAAAVLGSQVALIVLGMRADFERYLLPVEIVIAICLGVLVGSAGSTLWCWLRFLWSATRSVVDARPAPSGPDAAGLASVSAASSAATSTSRGAS